MFLMNQKRFLRKEWLDTTYEHEHESFTLRVMLQALLKVVSEAELQAATLTAEECGVKFEGTK